jgi:hypothetical protein
MDVVLYVWSVGIGRGESEGKGEGEGEGMDSLLAVFTTVLTLYGSKYLGIVV